MARKRTGLLLITASLVVGGAAGCQGDDTNPAAPDAGSAPDATTHGSSSGAVEDAGLLCAPIDAGIYPADQIALGRSIVVAMHCQVCHGESLSGNDDGVNSPGYGTAYPPNLTPDQATGLGCWTDYQIETAFLYGIDNQASVLCPPMPRFGEFEDGGGISPDQAPAVVAFLRTLPPISNNVPDSPNCTFFPPEDGGPSEDSGSEDSGTFDAGHHHHDAGSFDAGSDATVEDSGTDAASEDAATTDASDAGPSDASDDAGG